MAARTNTEPLHLMTPEVHWQIQDVAAALWAMRDATEQPVGPGRQRLLDTAASHAAAALADDVQVFLFPAPYKGGKQAEARLLPELDGWLVAQLGLKEARRHLAGMEERIELLREIRQGSLPTYSSLASHLGTVSLYEAAAALQLVEHARSGTLSGRNQGPDGPPENEQTPIATEARVNAIRAATRITNRLADLEDNHAIRPPKRLVAALQRVTHAEDPNAIADADLAAAKLEATIAIAESRPHLASEPATKAQTSVRTAAPTGSAKDRTTAGRRHPARARTRSSGSGPT